MLKTTQWRLLRIVMGAALLAALLGPMVANAGDASTPGWLYGGDAHGKEAMLGSSNTVDVGNGAGKQFAFLTFWHHDGTYSFTLSLQHGKFKCPGSCLIIVGFRDKKDPVMLNATSLDDNLLGIDKSDTMKLVNILEAGDTILLAAPYPSGEQVSIFETAGMDPNKI